MDRKNPHKIYYRKETGNMTLLQNKAIPLESIFPKSRFFVVSINPVKDFDEETNKVTDKIIGYKYLVVETYQYTRFQIKVIQDKPLMKADELERCMDHGENVFVVFKNATVKPYYSSRTKQLEDSILADGVILSENDNDDIVLD